MTTVLEHTGAIFLITLSYFTPLLFASIRNEKIQLAAFYIVITALQSVSLFNYFILTLPGADLDASTFSNNAVSAATNGAPPILSVGTGIYEYILYGTYSVFGANKLVGQSLSVLVSTIGLIFFLRIAHHLNVRNKLAIAALIIAGLTPSFLFYTSLTFREVFQLFGLLGGIYFAYEAFSRKSLARLFVSSVFFIFMGLFHHVLLALSFIVILITVTCFFFQTGSPIRIAAAKFLMSFIVISLVGYIVVLNIPADPGNDYIKILKESGGVVEMVDRYRKAVEQNLPRSTYGVKVDTTSAAGMAYGLVLSYINYLFGPSIFSIGKVIDFPPLINALGRILTFLLLIYLSIRNVQTVKKLGYFLVVYFSVTAMWSFGTTNYGQAFRHNSLTDWMLAIVLVIGLHAIATRRKIV